MALSGGSHQLQMGDKLLYTRAVSITGNYVDIFSASVWLLTLWLMAALPLGSFQ